MPEVCPAGCCQGGLQFLRPFRVGLGQPPDLVGGQAKFTEHRAERLAVVDRVEELLAHLYGEPLLRLAPKACPRGVVLRFTALVAVAAFQPAGQGAVDDLRAAAATLGIGLITDLMQLLPCPGRLGYQAQGEPPSDDRRRHIADGGGLAYRGDSFGLAHHTNASGPLV